MWLAVNRHWTCCCSAAGGAAAESVAATHGNSDPRSQVQSPSLFSLLPAVWHSSQQLSDLASPPLLNRGGEKPAISEPYSWGKQWQMWTLDYILVCLDHILVCFSPDLSCCCCLWPLGLQLMSMIPHWLMKFLVALGLVSSPPAADEASSWVVECGICKGKRTW